MSINMRMCEARKGKTKTHFNAKMFSSISISLESNKIGNHINNNTLYHQATFPPTDRSNSFLQLEIRSNPAAEILSSDIPVSVQKTFF